MTANNKSLFDSCSSGTAGAAADCAVSGMINHHPNPHHHHPQRISSGSSTSNNNDETTTVASFDFQDLGEDPLEWLVDIDSHEYLPESSLPTFPELTVPLPSSDDSAIQVLQSLQEEESSNKIVNGVAPAAVDFSGDTAAALNNIVDPNVALQSFLRGDDVDGLEQQ